MSSPQLILFSRSYLACRQDSWAHSLVWTPPSLISTLPPKSFRPSSILSNFYFSSFLSVLSSSFVLARKDSLRIASQYFRRSASVGNPTSITFCSSGVIFTIFQVLRAKYRFHSSERFVEWEAPRPRMSAPAKRSVTERKGSLILEI